MQKKRKTSERKRVSEYQVNHTERKQFNQSNNIKEISNYSFIFQ